jgi:hypothetical protein
MTVDAARRSRRRAPRASADSEPTITPPTTIAIGEFEQTVFDCPSCSRPLALGARRCPGCRSRIINGVTLGKASVFVAAGLAIGLLTGVGGSVVLGLGRAGGPASAAAIGGAGASPLSTASTAPATSTAPTASARPTPTAEGGMSPLTRAALVQVAGTNGRLALAADGLRALQGSSFDASAVARVLRSISADSIIGEQLAGRVVAWPASGTLGSQLSDFYGDVHATAAEALAFSVRNEAAYRTAAKDMLVLLDRMTVIDAAVLATARSAGIALPAASTAP